MAGTQAANDDWWRAFNLSDRAASWALPADGAGATLLEGAAASGLTGCRRDGQALRFDPWGGAYLRLA